MPIASHAAFTTAMSSDSTEHCAIVPGGLLYDLSTELTQSTVHPDLLLRLVFQPAQFACDFSLLIKSVARCLALWFAAEKFDRSKMNVPRAEAVNSFDSSLSGIVRVDAG